MGRLSWKEALEDDCSIQGDAPKSACNVCGGKCKTLLATRGGSNEITHQLSPKDEKNKNDAIEWWETPNPWIRQKDFGAIPEGVGAGGNMNVSSLELPQAEDMNQEARKWRNNDRCALGYPISKYEWGIDGDMRHGVVNFHRKATGDVSESLLKSIVQAGNHLVSVAGALDNAVSLFQEVEFMKLGPRRDYIAHHKA